jgi:predicted DNA-binding transcriptional regulator YafY
VKSFYLSRIQSAVLTDQRYAIPKSFNANAFFRDTFGLFVGGGKPFHFRVRFSPEVSEEIREQQWHPDQKIEMSREGQVTLELPARSIQEARRFVLAYGTDAEALSPPELIEDLATQASGLSRTYRSRKTGDGRGKAKGRKRP